MAWQRGFGPIQKITFTKFKFSNILIANPHRICASALPVARGAVQCFQGHSFCWIFASGPQSDEKGPPTASLACSVGYVDESN